MRVSTFAGVTGSIAASLVAATLLGSGAQAASHGYDEFRFEYDRSALSTQTGAETTYRDLQRSARHACRDTFGASHRMRRALRACEAEIVGAVIAASDSEALIALHENTPLSARRYTHERTYTIASR